MEGYVSPVEYYDAIAFNIAIFMSEIGVPNRVLVTKTEHDFLMMHAPRSGWGVSTVAGVPICVSAYPQRLKIVQAVAQLQSLRAWCVRASGQPVYDGVVHNP